jgi:acyl-CoA dehydrogenase
MTDLVLNDDQRQYQQLAREFAENEIAPKAEQLDHEKKTPEDVLRKAWELGLFNVRVPEEYGGFGLTLTDACLIAEELAAACSGVSSAFEGNELAVAPLLVAGSSSQKEEHLPSLTASFSLAGFAAAPVSYKKQGGQYQLSGKTVVLNATTGSWLLVTARGSGGDSVFVVASDESLRNTAQVVFPFGRKAGDIRRLSFQSVQAQLVGEEGNGAGIMRQSDVFSHAYMAAEAVGVGRSALQASVKYAKERTTFGVPIGNHQAVAFLLADMAKDTEAGRLLYMKAAWLADAGHQSAASSTIAKVFAVDAAMRIATDAVQVFGGYGYMREYPVEKLMRDAKVFQMMDASTHELKVSLGRELTAV